MEIIEETTEDRAETKKPPVASCAKAEHDLLANLPVTDLAVTDLAVADLAVADLAGAISTGVIFTADLSISFDFQSPLPSYFFKVQSRLYQVKGIFCF